MYTRKTKKTLPKHHILRITISRLHLKTPGGTVIHHEPKDYLPYPP